MRVWIRRQVVGVSGMDWYNNMLVPEGQAGSSCARRRRPGVRPLGFDKVLKVKVKLDVSTCSLRGLPVPHV